MDNQILDGSKESSNLNEESRLCAWCLEKAGITPKATDSHGICEKCQAIFLAQYYEWKARNLAGS